MLSSQDAKVEAELVVLSQSQIQKILDAFLSAPERPEYTMNFYQLDGYVRAMTLGPEPVALEEWLPLVFVDQDPNFSDKEQELFIIHTLNCLYNMHKVQLLSSLCDLPCVNQYSEIRSERINIEQWARGFMQGFIVCQNHWNFFLEEGQTDGQLPAIIKNTIYDEIDATISIISSVADAEYALSQGITTAELERIFCQLPEQIIEYGKVGQLIRKYM